MIFKKDPLINICFVAPRIFSLYNKKFNIPFGGAEVQLFLLSKELAKNKTFKINVIAGNFDLKKKRRVNFQNIKIYISQPLDKKKINHIRRPLNLFLTLIKINPDVVIQRITGVQTVICAFYCKLFKKKFIFSIAHKREVNRGGMKGITGKFYHYGFKKSTYIVAQNKDQIIDLENWKKKKFSNIKVIKSGYEIQNKKNNIKNKKNILWVSRAIKWKRPECFLKLAEKFPNEIFIMICRKSHDEYYWNKIKKSAKELSNLKFFNFIPFHEIDKYFKNAKIFINTSTYEGFPNTFVQALKNKTPIISLNVDPDNFLIRNKCGFNCIDDFTKMEYYLRMLLENQELYKSYSRNSYLYVKKNHDIEKIGNEWTVLVKNILRI